MGRTEDNPRVHFSLAPTQSSPCGSVAFSWSIEALLHLPKAKGVVVRACGRGRGAGAATLCFLLPFISWSSTHFANFASLIFPSPGGLVKQTLLPLFHRWRGSSAEGMWQAQGHPASPWDEPRIETRPPATNPVLLWFLWTLQLAQWLNLFTASLNIPTSTASKISFVSVTPHPGDPGPRLALSIFWVPCSTHFVMIPSQEQSLMKTLILQRSCLIATAWLLPKAEQISALPVSLYSESDVFVSLQSLLTLVADSSFNWEWGCTG